MRVGKLLLTVRQHTRRSMFSRTSSASPQRSPPDQSSLTRTLSEIRKLMMAIAPSTFTEVDTKPKSMKTIIVFPYTQFTKKFRYGF